MDDKPKITVDDWIASLRSYIGVRFRHQGRSRDYGVDCIGLAVCAALDIGIAHGAERIVGYSRIPTDNDFDKWAGRFSVPLPYNRLQAIDRQVKVGDIITFWIEQQGVTRHVAVYTGRDTQGRPSMIHSYAKEDRGVIECAINPNYWTRRISRIYRLPEFCEE